MAAHHRRRLASALAHCLFATGVTGALGCAVDASPPPSVPGTPENRIEHSLGQLAELDVLEIGALAALRTEHQWVPYGGTWSASRVEMDLVEQADRLDSLADMAAQAVAGIDAGDIDDIEEFSVDAVCYKSNPAGTA